MTGLDLTRPDPTRPDPTRLDSIQVRERRGNYACVSSTHKGMAKEKTRVDFNAPKSLVERAGD